MRKHRWIPIVFLAGMLAMMFAPPSVVTSIYSSGAPVFTTPQEESESESVITPAEKATGLFTSVGARKLLFVTMGTLLAGGFAALVTREHMRRESEDELDEEAGGPDQSR